MKRTKPCLQHWSCIEEVVHEPTCSNLPQWHHEKDEERKWILRSCLFQEEHFPFKIIIFRIILRIEIKYLFLPHISCHFSLNGQIKREVSQLNTIHTRSISDHVVLGYFVRETQKQRSVERSQTGHLLFSCSILARRSSNSLIRLLVKPAQRTSNPRTERTAFHNCFVEQTERLWTDQMTRTRASSCGFSPNSLFFLNIRFSQLFEDFTILFGSPPNAAIFCFSHSIPFL